MRSDRYALYKTFKSSMGLVLCLILYTSVYGQGTWTWIGGDSIGTVSRYAHRGIKGVPSTLNYPDSTLSGNYDWKDKSGRIWIMSANNGSSSNIADLWTYEPSSNIWTWVAGGDSFDIKSNTPDSLVSALKFLDAYSIGFQKWTDSSNNLWFLADAISINNNPLNLILKLDIATMKLEVIQISADAYYHRGIKGLAAAANWPGVNARASIWTVGNTMYMFGGYSSTGGGENNELWKYDMDTKLWTWLGGSIWNASDYSYSYGAKGVPSASNWPPLNTTTNVSWTKGNKIYLYGGGDRVNDYYSDLWEYDISTGLWTWLEGSSTLNHPGIYPTEFCIDSPGVFPSSRNHFNQSRTNVCNNSFWLFSGYYNTSSGNNNSYRALGDLWLYKPNTNRWVWVDGARLDTSTYFGSYNYGVKGIASLSNRPPSKGSSLMWTDNQDRIYVFGGGMQNDLWRYDPDYSCINYDLSDKFIDRNIDYKICEGDSTVMRVCSGYDSLRVIPMTNVSISGNSSTGASIVLKPSANKNYQIIAYGYRCESHLDSLTVPIQVFPPRTSSESKTICYGESYMGKNSSGTYHFKYPDIISCDSVHTLYLTVDSQIIHVLDTTDCEGTSVFGRMNSGTYYDTFVAANGCDSIRQVNLTIIPKYLRIDTSICRGANIAGYTNAGTYYDTLTSPEGCITFRTIILGIKEHSSSSHSQTICQGQTYWGYSMAGTHIDTLVAANGCDSVRTLNLTVHPLSYSQEDTAICIGTTYLGHSTAGTYYDTLQNINGCDSIHTLILTIRNPKAINKLKDTSICKGSKAFLDAGIGHKGYLWSTGESTSSIEVLNAMEYKLTYTDAQDCKGYDSATVRFHNDSEIVMEESLSNYSGELLILNPQILPSDYLGKYKWLPSHVFDCDTCSSVRFRLDSSLIVRLEYTDAQGCTSSKEVQINIFDSWAVGFPKAFSPNGDQKNDFYYPNTENILSYHMAIYNRWGEKVFETNTLESKWDGNYKGRPSRNGSYTYYSEVILLNQAKHIYQGTFHLIR